MHGLRQVYRLLAAELPQPGPCGGFLARQHGHVLDIDTPKRNKMHGNRHSLVKSHVLLDTHKQEHSDKYIHGTTLVCSLMPICLYTLSVHT